MAFWRHAFHHAGQNKQKIPASFSCFTSFYKDASDTEKLDKSEQKLFECFLTTSSFSGRADAAANRSRCSGAELAIESIQETSS
jgi:hypothetical protein